MNRQYLKTIGLTDEQAAEVQHLFDLERLKVRALAEALARCRRCRFYCRRRRRHPPTSTKSGAGELTPGGGASSISEAFFGKRNHAKIRASKEGPNPL